MFYHRTRVRSHICVFSSILRGYRTTTLFSAAPRSLVLNFLRCGFATSIPPSPFRLFSFYYVLPDPSYLLSSSSSSLQPRSAVLLSVLLVLLSVTLVVSLAFVFIPLAPACTLRVSTPVSVLFAILSILFAAHLNAWRTTWDKKGIHGRATRRTPETQIYSFNTVNITVPRNAWAMRRSILTLWKHIWLSGTCRKSNRYPHKKYIYFELNFSSYLLF